jgi:hypothetical protein
VHRSDDLLRSKVSSYSLLAAAVAAPATLVLSALGQGAGAVVAGCQWIGISVPVGRQVWALVNQPSMAFASEDRALWYWLGSLLVPLAAAALTVHLGPRARSLSAELLAVHVAWASATIGLAWLPLVDAHDGHLSRLLYLRDLPEQLVWGAPLLGALLGCIPALRLTSLALRARRNLSRAARLGLVTLHLAVPTAAWFALTSWINQAVTPRLAWGLAAPVITALALTWFRYPAAHVRTLDEISGWAAVRAVLAIAVLGSTLWWTGRPSGPDRWRGLLWGTPSALNNIRPWIETDADWQYEIQGDGNSPAAGAG